MFTTTGLSAMPTRVAIAWQDGPVSRFATLWVKDGKPVMALTRPRTKGEGFTVDLDPAAEVTWSVADADLRAAHGVRLCHDPVCGGAHPVTRVKPGRGAITCVTRNTARVKRQRVEAKVITAAEARAAAWLATLAADRKVAAARVRATEWLAVLRPVAAPKPARRRAARAA